MVVYENGLDGSGAFGIGSDDAVPCKGGVGQTECDGFGEDLCQLFGVVSSKLEEGDYI